MILECLQCSSRFFLDSSNLLPKGRRVKCCKCGHVWYEKPESLLASKREDVSSLEADYVPIVSGSNLSVIVGKLEINKTYTLWLLVAVLAILIGWFAWIGKQSIIKIWPFMNDVYSVLYSILGY